MQKPRIESNAARNISELRVFDPVKLDLAVMALVVLGALLVIARLDAPHWVELLITAALGVGGGAWIVLRTRHVARTFTAQTLTSMHRVQRRGNGP